MVWGQHGDGSAPRVPCCRARAAAVPHPRPPVGDARPVSPCPRAASGMQSRVSKLPSPTGSIAAAVPGGCHPGPWPLPGNGAVATGPRTWAPCAGAACGRRAAAAGPVLGCVPPAWLGLGSPQGICPRPSGGRLSAPFPGAVLSAALCAGKEAPGSGPCYLCFPTAMRSALQHGPHQNKGGQGRLLPSPGVAFVLSGALQGSSPRAALTSLGLSRSSSCQLGMASFVGVPSPPGARCLLQRCLALPARGCSEPPVCPPSPGAHPISPPGPVLGGLGAGWASQCSSWEPRQPAPGMLGRRRDRDEPTRAGSGAGCWSKRDPAL